jgi:hypothetical protein
VTAKEMTDNQYFTELRAGLVVRDDGPGLIYADDRARAIAELHRAREAERRDLLSLPDGDAA